MWFNSFHIYFVVLLCPFCSFSFCFILCIAYALANSTKRWYFFPRFFSFGVWKKKLQGIIKLDLSLQTKKNSSGFLCNYSRIFIMESTTHISGQQLHQPIPGTKLWWQCMSWWKRVWLLVYSHGVWKAIFSLGFVGGSRKQLCECELSVASGDAVYPQHQFACLMAFWLLLFQWHSRHVAVISMALTTQVNRWQKWWPMKRSVIIKIWL